MVGALVQLVVVLLQVRVRRMMRRVGAVRRMRTVRVAVVRVMPKRMRRMRLVHRVPGLRLLLRLLVGRRSVAIAIVGETRVVVGPRATPIAVGGQDGGGLLGLS